MTLVSPSPVAIAPAVSYRYWSILHTHVGPTLAEPQFWGMPTVFGFNLWGPPL